MKYLAYLIFGKFGHTFLFLSLAVLMMFLCMLIKISIKFVKKCTRLNGGLEFWKRLMLKFKIFSEQ